MSIRFSPFLHRGLNLRTHLIFQLPGECLDDIWMDLEPRQIMTVCARLGELLVKLFNCRSLLLCSETDVPDSPHERLRRRPITVGPYS